MDILIAGALILALAVVPPYLFSLPIVYMNTQLKYKLVDGYDPKLDGYISDQQASLYGIFFSGSMFVSPMAGAALYDAFGYRSSFDIMMFIMFNCFLFYWFVVAGLSPIKEHRK